MKIILLGDLHIGIKNGNQTMMNHQKSLFDFVFQYCKDHKIDTIIQLGDQFDERKKCSYKVLDFAYNAFFDRIEDNKINYYTIIGNHDVFYRETLSITSSDLLFRKYKYVKIFDQCATLEFDNIKFDLIPWICNENSRQCFDYIKNSNSDYCCGHFEINSFPMLGDQLFDQGIDYKIFEHYDHVWSGHFHNRSRKYNITYIGTPYPLTWGEALADKGFYVFDTKTRTTEFITNNDKYYYYLTYDDSQPNKTTPIKQLKLTDCFVKVIVAHKSKNTLFNNYINSIFNCNTADVKIINQTVIDNHKVDVDDIKTSNTVDLINKYVDNLAIENKSEVLHTLINLYNQSIMIQDDIDVNVE